MKKVFLALSLVMVLGLASCSDKIDKLESLKKEYQKLEKERDELEDKMKEKSKEAMKVMDEIDYDKLSDKDKERLNKVLSND